ncbi:MULTISPECIES: type II secretion system protein N [Marinobacter]|uniref:Type II secretion system protein N n=1 Tax=Marinobacter xiaoshiensis TaxID=3073652 RepID=A0ABU2HGZ7_9GAMM|nr:MULTISPECIES: type II secretion system protein N [unclassified Marinobacter]MBK1887829.1 general secretion pathway protein GspC [Marinobacter sp. DY40_1A1]MDS1310343.1 type II secretion system protein N [Marinobacter sp. F60267]
MLSINPKVPPALAIVAGLAMVGVTAWQSYGFWQTQSNIAPQGKTAVTQPLEDKRNTPKLPLASLELFGTAQIGQIEAEESTEDLPETNLRIFLRGVLAADGEFPGSALIENDKSKTDVFLVGDELPGNAKLRSVHPNRVILDRGGKLENLYFPEPDDRSGMTFSAGADDLDQAEGPAETPSTSSLPTPATPAANDQPRREEIRKRLEQLRERLRTNG